MNNDHSEESNEITVLKARLAELQDEFAALADELEAEGRQFRSSARPYKHAEAMAKLDVAARVRAALEGSDQ